MQILIDIEDSKYIHMKTFEEIYRDMIGRFELELAVLNGIVLPKNHGRLIDADRLRSMYSINRANFNTVVGIQKWIDDAPTIIEADKAEREGKQ